MIAGWVVTPQPRPKSFYAALQSLEKHYEGLLKALITFSNTFEQAPQK